MKICKNCKHYVAFGRCTHPILGEIDPVYGNKPEKYCAELRDEKPNKTNPFMANLGLCGPDATLYEPKLLEKICKLLKLT